MVLSSRDKELVVPAMLFILFAFVMYRYILPALAVAFAGIDARTWVVVVITFAGLIIIFAWGLKDLERMMEKGS